MPSRGWTAGLLSAGLLIAGASTGLSPAGAAPAAAGTRPTVGECRQLTATQVAAPTDTSGPIPCSTTHDDRVIGVPNLPTGVTWAELDTSTKVVHMGVTLCTPPWRSALGQSDRLRDRTAYSFVFFRPTRKQQASGARWLRCDLVLLHGPSLAPLPTDREPALPGTTIPRTVRRCLGGKQLLTTACTYPHRYRATGSFVVGSKTFPGRKTMLRISRTRCPAYVRTPHDFWFTYHGAFEWNHLHERAVVCYTRTTS